MTLMHYLFLFILLLFAPTAGAQSQASLQEAELLTSLPNSWVMLSRTDTGYVIYDPCDGGNPGIRINGDTLTILSRLEFSRHLIQKFEKVNDTLYRIVAGGIAYYEPYFQEFDSFELNIRVIDPELQMSLWWPIPFESPGTSPGKWLLVPEEHTSFFGLVTNPCPEMKKPEIEFLPIEFD